MPKFYYQNKKTKRICLLITNYKNEVQVRYYPSGLRSWFKIEDFNRMFEKLK